VFDNEEEVSKNTTIRIITLENCIKIMQDAQKHQPNVFAVSFLLLYALKYVVSRIELLGRKSSGSGLSI
jgi:hypothetical protein